LAYTGRLLLFRRGRRTHILCYDPGAEKVPDQEVVEVAETRFGGEV